MRLFNEYAKNIFIFYSFQKLNLLYKILYIKLYI